MNRVYKLLILATSLFCALAASISAAPGDLKPTKGSATEGLPTRITVFSPLGGVTGGAVNAIAISGSNVYVGGTFDAAGDISANYIAKWDGTTWSTLGSGMNGF